MVKKMQTSIMDYVVLVLNVFCRYYVGGGDESPLLVVPVCDISTDRVWGTVWWRSMEEAVVRIRWGIPSCMYICFPTAGIVFVVFVCSHFRFEPFELSCF